MVWAQVPSPTIRDVAQGREGSQGEPVGGLGDQAEHLGSGQLWPRRQAEGDDPYQHRGDVGGAGLDLVERIESPDHVVTVGFARRVSPCGRRTTT